MNKQIFKGKWHEIKGKLQQQWNQLTNDDLERIQANNEEIYGILEKHYGYAKEEVINQVKDFAEQISAAFPGLETAKDFGMKSWNALSSAVKAHPVRTILLALSTAAVVRRLVKHH